MNVTLHRNEILAALLFASDDESRFVLNGIKVECKADKPPVLITTDGRRLVAIESSADIENLPDEDGEFILSAAFIKPICALSKALGGKIFPWLAIEVNGENVSVELIGVKAFVRATRDAIIEGIFPNWREVVPHNIVPVPTTDIGINSEYIGDFAKAAKIMELESPLISMGFSNEEGPIQVRISGMDRFYGVIMPCKNDKPRSYQPEFLGIK